MSISRNMQKTWNLLLLSCLAMAAAPVACSDDSSDGDGPSTPSAAGSTSTSMTAGITVNAASDLRTTEAGGQVTFSLVLKSKPSANVVIPLSTSNAAEGVLSVASLTFTPTNWNAPQTVTVTGVDDTRADGNTAYAIVIGAAQSADTAYNGLNAEDVNVTNVDNETASVIVTPTSGLTTTEAGAQATFSVVLSSQPKSDVVIGLTSSDVSEGSVTPASLTFTASNWNAPQTVTVVGVDDSEMDGNITYLVTTSATQSQDTAYNGKAVDDVTIVNNDNEKAGVTVSAGANLATSEAGANASFTVVLNSAPTADVVLSVASSDASEGAVSAPSLTFSAANWNAPQTITVTGVDDSVADGSQAYSVVLGPTASSDVGYNGISVSSVPLTNTDNETPGIAVVAAPSLTTSEAGSAAAFTVALTSAPVADVTLGVASSDTSEGTVSAPTLTFTSTNWNAPQTVTITGIDDRIVDGNQAYAVLLGPASSTDTNYNGMTSPNLAVTNNDNDTAGVSVSADANLVTTERGGQASFSVVLSSAPTADVVLSLASSKPAEGLVSASSLTFTSLNWNAPQAVTLTGIDDQLADGNQSYQILIGPAVSSDAAYGGQVIPSVSVTNTDDETAGITVVSTDSPTTTEAGGQTSFTLVLNSEPEGDVVVPVSSDNTGEGTVGASSLIFTPLNWAAPQTVTVTGVEDAIADGGQQYHVVLGPATSSDADYNAMTIPSVTVSNTDNETAGITVTAAPELATTEAGAQATFTVVLNSEPVADVVISVASEDTTEGTVSTSSLTFTPVNWNAPQTVTLTGVEDEVADGNQPYRVLLGPIASGDPNYGAMTIPSVSVTNTDNDSAGITVTQSANLTTTEAGGQTSFMVVLNSEPTADVTFSVTSGDTTEGTVSTSSLIFTPVNWKAPQTITVTGMDDAVADGNQPFAVLVGPSSSTDANYAGIAVPNVVITNTDNDSAGITLTKPESLTTTEAGGQTSFSVVLNSEPTADVVLNLLSSDTTEGTLGTTALTFTPANWNAPQTVTITGANDDVQDGNQPYNILVGPASSSDAKYSDMAVANVSVTNTDNDTAGITVTKNASLSTTETGGQTSFTVVLNSEPTANVVLSIASSDVTEGTLSASSLTFTASNWNAPQTITVTGADDSVADGNQPYTVMFGAASSSDTNYNALTVPNVALTNTDNDTAGITVTKVASLSTTESGTQTSFTVVLNSEPTANVVLSVASSDTTEGTVSTSSLTFTASNWNAPQTVTITGRDDFVADGNQPYSVLLGPASSADAKYGAMAVPNVQVSNTDNDTAGIAVVAATNLTTTEASGQVSLTVALTSEPTADVVLSVASSDTTEGTVSASSLTFTALNWNAPQTITITGVNDNVADGNQPYNVLLGPATSSDSKYKAMSVPNVAVINTDNDSAGITVTKAASLTTTEAGVQVSFTAVLNSEPTADVVLSVASSDTTEGTVSASSLTFTALNWNAPQTITITGVNDNVADGNQPYNVLLGPATSSDANYKAMNVPNVAVINTDDDSAGITVTKAASLTTTEAGAQVSFTAVLNSEPTANVVLSVASSDTTEGTVSASSLTFTALNWNAPQTITITGVNDNVADGNQPYNVLLGPATSSDTNYQAMSVPNVAVSNTDDDSAGITVTKAASLTTTEAGLQVSLTVALTSEPTADVVLSVASSDTTEGTVSASSLTFTALNWSAPQTITITGVNDNVADGNQPYNVLLGPATSSDSKYDTRSVPNVSVTNTDNDSPGVTVNAAANLTTTEAGGTATFTVVLTSEPTANVVISVASNKAAEGTVSPASLTFTALNWNAPQTVTATGVNDFVADGNQTYAVLLGPASSSDANYGARTIPNVSLTNTDNDTAGITVTAASNLTTTEAGGTASFTVVLTSQPTVNVTIPVSSNDATEGTVSPASLTFTSANWSMAQTVTVTGVNDFVADGNQSYAALLGPATSTDAGYGGKTIPNVTLTNTDNDTAGITVTAASNLTTTEAGGTASFTVVLTSQPTVNVTIPVSSNDTTEGTVSPASLTFTSANWSTAQTVTVTGVNDFVADGNQSYAALLGPATSTDAGYGGKTIPNVTLTNTDNDSVGFTVSPTSIATGEWGLNATFTVVLTSEPTANVSIGVTSGDTTEGTVSPGSLTFTAGTWNVAQTVTVTSVNDGSVDGDQTYNVVLAAATSSDPKYNGQNPADVTVLNYDYVHTFTFTDTTADDISQTAIDDFLGSFTVNSTDYIFFSVTGGSEGGAWCAERADWYASNYRSLAPTAGNIASGTWNKWWRTTSGSWSSAETSTNTNHFGSNCDSIAYSWCSEWGLGGLYLGIMPGETSSSGECYASNWSSGENWVFTLKIGGGRSVTCGF